MKTPEIWRPVAGYEGMYEVSSLGRVRSLDRITSRSSTTTRKIKGKIKKIVTSGQEYPMVMLSKGSKYKNCKLHRLIAVAFIPNPNQKPEINHIDGDKLNYSPGNLEWTTRKDNTIHAYRLGLIYFNRGQDCIHAKLTEKNVAEIKDMLKIGLPCRWIAQLYSVHRNTVSDIKFNRTWLHVA